MAVSPEILQAEKQGINALGTINDATRTILSLLDPQQKNLFEMILIREVPPNLNGTTFASELKSVALSALDTTIAKVFVQNLDIPHNSVDFTRFDYLQAITDFTYADEVTITFLETESAIVRTFLKNWMALSFTRDLIHGGYVFNDNQWDARKKAIIIPKGRTGIPNTVWLEIRGLRFKTIENFAFDQQTSDPLMITVTFACDEIYLNSLF